MASQIIATGLGGATFKNVLRVGLRRANPKALGLAVAYVSVSGLRYMQGLVSAGKIKQLRLVTDTGDAITHPIALANALSDGWEVRVVDTLPGTFHPKLYIAGDDFDTTLGIKNTCLILTGSQNLSAASLSRNGECCFVHLGSVHGDSGAKAWKTCWDAGRQLTPPLLDAYAKYFAQRNKRRTAADLVTLGVADEQPTAEGVPEKTATPPPNNQKAVPNTAATTAWAGLQSFTGDYNLQVEFPRDAGEVLARLLRTSATTNSANFLCEDSQTRRFIFRYYPDNGMFRLNVHNSTPNADWARVNKDGVAIVEINEDGVPTFSIVKPGRELNAITRRSFALGTWGRTPTRLYGWY